MMIATVRMVYSMFLGHLKHRGVGMLGAGIRGDGSIAIGR
jgi:hypothetical protein